MVVAPEVVRTKSSPTIRFWSAKMLGFISSDAGGPSGVFIATTGYLFRKLNGGLACVASQAAGVWMVCAIDPDQGTSFGIEQRLGEGGCY